MFLRPDGDRGQHQQQQQSPIQNRAAVAPLAQSSTDLYSRNNSRRHGQHKLPIFRFQRCIQWMIQKYRVLVIVGETGSGKTTQIPQFLLEAGWADNGQQIVVTQPRQVAALSVAARVADELGSRIGDVVGYSVRFNNKTSERCKIRFTTDGTLLREMMQDPLLSKYSVIIIDEAHERAVHSDLLIGLLRKTCVKRPKLRLIISSATLDAGKFKRFFETNKTLDDSRDTASVLTVDGRQHPVQVSYLGEATADYVSAAVKLVMEMHNTWGAGDVLVFMPGQEQVENVVARLNDQEPKSKRNGSMLSACPLFAGMNPRDQLRALLPSGRGSGDRRQGISQRKVVVATNVAEASLTIEGVVYVIDCCLVKQPHHDPRTGLNTLFIQPISQAQAKQRAGRAGRVRAGHCIRLCTEEAFKQLHAATVPELQRTDLTWATLQLKALGIQNVLRFKFISPPPADAMGRALEHLYSLGAITSDVELTPTVGMEMVELPIEPRLSCVLLKSLDLGCTEEAMTLVAMLSIPSPVLQGSTNAIEAKRRTCVSLFGAQEGDHIFYVNLFNAWLDDSKSRAFCTSNALNFGLMSRANDLRAHLKGYMTRLAKRRGLTLLSCCEDVTPLLKALVAGYFGNAARLAGDGTYRTVKDNRSVTIHPSSTLASNGTPPTWIVYHETQFTTSEFVKTITAIKPMWLSELAPHYYQLSEQTAGALVGVGSGVSRSGGGGHRRKSGRDETFGTGIAGAFGLRF